MSWTIRFFALILCTGALAGPLCAEPTPGPPDWQDGASVYLGTGRQAATGSEPIERQSPYNGTPMATTGVTSRTPSEVDSAVTLSVHGAVASPAPATRDRHLAPPSGKAALDVGSGQSDDSVHRSPSTSRRLVDFGVPLESLYTILSALAVVIGLFLLFAWLLRRGGRRSSRGGYLPADVVSVLGRVPLAARQFAELLRVGNKLVLVSFTPNGVETLTEVTDPVEVDRLLGLCHESNPHSTTKAFEQVFRQLSSESAPGGFLGGESMPASFSSPAAAYRAHRGDATRG